MHLSVKYQYFTLNFYLKHFSRLTMFLKVENFTKKLASNQDVVDAINKQQSFSNNERIKNGLEPIETIPIIHNFLNQNFVNELVVDHLKCFYNFFTDKNFILNSVIVSDLKESIQIPFKAFENVPAKSKKIKNQSLIENPIIDEQISTQFLKKKHLMIKNMIDLKTGYFNNKTISSKKYE
jgi:hypothetical protein